MSFAPRTQKICWGGGLVLILLLGLFFLSSSFVPARKMGPLPRAVSVQDKIYTLEIADTRAKQKLGLGERTSLCGSCGMLFVFHEPQRYVFWMEGMRFSLDIVWLLGEKVVDIQKRVPFDSQTLFTPKSEADAVLELNAGEAGTLQVGEDVKFVY